VLGVDAGCIRLRCLLWILRALRHCLLHLLLAPCLQLFSDHQWLLSASVRISRANVNIVECLCWGSIHVYTVNHFEENATVTLWFGGYLEVIIGFVFVFGVWEFVLAYSIEYSALNDTFVIDLHGIGFGCDFGRLVCESERGWGKFVPAPVYIHTEGLCVRCFGQVLLRVDQLHGAVECRHKP